MAQGAEHEAIECKKGNGEKTPDTKSSHGIGDSFRHIQYDSNNEAVSRVRGVITFAHEPQGRNHESPCHGHNKSSAKSQERRFSLMRILADFAKGVAQGHKGGYDIGRVKCVGVSLCAHGKVEHATAHEDVDYHGDEKKR